MPVPDAACRGGWRKFLRRRSVAGSLVVLLMVPLAQSCGERGAKESAGRDETYDTGTLVADLFAIYESLGPGQSPMDAEAERLLSESLGAPDSDPNWPTLTFIAAEIELRQGNTGNAGRSFRNLAKWGSSTEPDPQESGSWGGSGLAVLGLWRWLEILEDQDAAPADRVSEAIEVALKLRSTRFYRGMLESGPPSWIAPAGRGSGADACASGVEDRAPEAAHAVPRGAGHLCDSSRAAGGSGHHRRTDRRRPA